MVAFEDLKATRPSAYYWYDVTDCTCGLFVDHGVGWEDQQSSRGLWR